MSRDSWKTRITSAASLERVTREMARDLVLRVVY